MGQGKKRTEHRRLSYPTIALPEIAPGFAEVEICLRDNGVELKAALFGGSTVSDSGVAGRAGSLRNELRPALEWVFSQ